MRGLRRRVSHQLERTPFVNRPLVFASTALVAIAVLSGCTAEPASTPAATTSASAPSATATPSPTSTPAPTATVVPTEAPVVAPTLEDMRLWITAAGFPCDSLTVREGDTGVLGAVSDATCNSGAGFVLATFANQEDIQAVVDLSAESGEPGIFLVGDLWFISGEIPEDLETLRAVAGGEIIEAVYPPVGG